MQCLNCGHELHGQFCSECGQRAVPPHPTVRELAGDAFAEFSGWDGKFAETIRRLTGSSAPIVFKPIPEDDPKMRRPDITKARELAV